MIKRPLLSRNMQGVILYLISILDFLVLLQYFSTFPIMNQNKLKKVH